MNETGFKNPQLEGMTHGGELVRMPLYSRIEGNLWVGGAPVMMPPAHFHFLVNLHSVARYDLHPHQMQVSALVYDAPVVPESGLLRHLSILVRDFMARGPVLVHCQMGINRSALVAALALIEGGMAPAAAIALLREKRCSAVLCNGTFERWLLSLDQPKLEFPA